jgi:TonB family protein
LLTTLPTPSGTLNSWEPKELGIPRATAMSVALVLLICAFSYWASVILAPKPKLQAIQVTQAQLVQLPAPTPPPPPKVVPPPKPLPAIIPKPAPVPSKIVVATKPPPPVHHIYKPVTHPVVTHQPAPPVPITHPAPPQAAPVTHAAPAQPSAAPAANGLAIYGSEMRNILQQNHNVPQALAQLGISGTAIVEIVVAPDGHVISAKLVKSGGNSLIDQTALDHALHTTFAPFSTDMPASSQAFIIPVEILPESDGSGSGSDSDSDSDSDN